MNSTFKSTLPYFIITGISFVILNFIFGDAFLHPNTYSFMTGGDGNVIYYNMIYHILYGGGFFLDNMNYPEPECIFMTDAQASISILLTQLKFLFPSISSHVVGITHVIIMCGICLQYIFLYKIIRKLGGQTWLAILFAIAIGTLAPQLVRIRYGHLGLAYPFIIPATIYWLLTFREYPYWNWRTLGFSLLILFFGFNNPYLLVVTSAFLVAYGLVVSLSDRRTIKNYFPIILGLGFLALLYIVTHALDPYPDRIKNQWGSYYFSSTIEDLLWGRYGLLNTILDSIGIDYKGRSESRASIALMALLILIVGGIRKLLKWNRRTITLGSSPLTMMGLACIPIFLYASSLFKSKWWLWLTEDLGFITMVKATGRFSWIIYYVLSLIAVSLIIKLSKSPHRIVQFIIPIVSIIWIGEGYLFVKDHVRPQLFNNQYSDTALDNYLRAKSEVINFNRYQAVLTVPVIQTWNDNLMDSGDWATDIHALSLSLATGLPLLSSKISRSPIRRSLENLQFGADPLIPRDLIGKLDPSQPILLIKTCNINHLSPGESWMLEHATIQYQDDAVDIYEIWPAELNNQEYLARALAQCEQQGAWHYYEGFDQNSTKGKINNGLFISTEWAAIDTIKIPESISGTYELSIWSQVNIEKYGMPQFELWIFDENGNKQSYEYIDSRNYIDNQDGWLKMHKNIAVRPLQSIIVKARGRYPMLIDELLLRPVNNHVTCIENNGRTLINNIRITEL